MKVVLSLLLACLTPAGCPQSCVAWCKIGTCAAACVCAAGCLSSELCGVVSKRYVLAAADLREERKLQAVLDAAAADTRCPPLPLRSPFHPFMRSL